ncbi:MAG: hypothetical protein F4Y86_02390 [Gammaproteobacteria bacterium]|nr:hypothetical protein [Gammaproteobacteria bacterium]MYB38929.1 hypothetical protein [Gammaproteobacteria bacterium]
MIHRAFALAITMVLAATSTQAQTNAALREELLELRETDQAGRVHLNDAIQEHGPNSPEVFALWEEQERVDAQNLRRLREVISEHGWPSISMVGYDGAATAFLIVQHAANEAQVELLPLLVAAADAGEADPGHVAMLQDRGLVAQDKRQLYGTQLYHDEATGELKLYPIEDEANVDARRREVGLSPLAEYVDAVKGVRRDD